MRRGLAFPGIVATPGPAVPRSLCTGPAGVQRGPGTGTDMSLLLAGGRRLADDEVEDGAHGAADVLDAKRLADDRGASLPDELSHVPAQRAGGGKNEPVTELRVMLLDPPVETDAVEPRH